MLPFANRERWAIGGLLHGSKTINAEAQWRPENPFRNNDFSYLFEMGSSALQGVIPMYGEHMEGPCCDSVARNGVVAAWGQR
mgnify:FL=1